VVRKSIDLVALFYLATALICFLPYFQYGHAILIAAGLIYAIPFFVVGIGLALRKGWGRRLGMIASPLLILVVLPMLFKKHLTFIFSFPYSIAITYPPSSALAVKGLFGGLIIGHLMMLLFLLIKSVREEFQQERGAAVPTRTKREKEPAVKS